MVSCEKFINFRKEHFLQFRFFKVDITSFCSKYAYSAELKKHMYFSKEIN
jgi:hypothetical protein